MDGAGGQNPETRRIYFRGAWHHAEIPHFPARPRPQVGPCILRPLPWVYTDPLLISRSQPQTPRLAPRFRQILSSGRDSDPIPFSGPAPTLWPPAFQPS